MSEMSWQYIAGFFDGEGCITTLTMKSGHKIPARITMGQSGREGQSVLKEISGFLIKQGIRGSVSLPSYWPPSKKGKNFKQMFYLVVNSKKGSIDFLRGVLPFLRVKRVQAQDNLRYLVLYPYAGNRDSCVIDLRTIKGEIAEGLTLKQIAEKYKVKYNTLWMRLNKRHTSEIFMFSKRAA